jgi:hypothetical protein
LEIEKEVKIMSQKQFDRMENLLLDVVRMVGNSNKDLLEDQVPIWEKHVKNERD